MTDKARGIIEKWYEKLDFPAEYDEQFKDIIENEEFDENISYDTYAEDESNGRLNLLVALYRLEETQKKYDEIGIPYNIFYDTFQDIVRVARLYTEHRGYFCLSQMGWFKKHFELKLFQLGRLQFDKNQYWWDLPELNGKKGDPVLSIHIPIAGPLDIEECKKSIQMAREFFSEYFPEYKYEYFACYSWLMDQNLKDYLKPDSNILKFQEFFKIVKTEETYSLLRFVFGLETTLENLHERQPKSAFAEAIKKDILAGKKFYENYGVFKK